MRLMKVLLVVLPLSIYPQFFILPSLKIGTCLKTITTHRWWAHVNELRIYEELGPILDSKKPYNTFKQVFVSMCVCVASIF